MQFTCHLYSGRGKDFRTDFEKIGGSIKSNNISTIYGVDSFSTTRCASVRSLHLDNPVYVEGNLDRPNIYMSANAIKSVNVSVRWFL